MKDDTISRKAAIEALKDCVYEIDGYYCEYDRVIDEDDAIEVINMLPPAQPYTDEEIQKMQDIEQAQLDKAYEMGKADAMAEIIRCRECKWHNGEINQCNAQICASMRGEDFCSRAERREDDHD